MTSRRGTGPRASVRWWAVAGALVVAAAAPLATSCAASAGTPAAPGPSVPAPGSISAPQTPPQQTPAPPTTAGPVSVPGTVRPGALPGCFILFADDGRHFVVSDVSDPPVDVPVTVKGVADPSEMSRCNGGTVLHTQSIATR